MPVHQTKSLNVFKTSYKVVRENSNEIYKGFGFKHLSDATQYYVHQDNESFKGTTTLCQPIGEALLFFATMVQSMESGEAVGDYFVKEDREVVCLDLHVPEDYREKGVVAQSIHRYRARSIGTKVEISAYDERGRWLEGDMSHLRPLYKLLPVFMVLLAREMESSEEFRKMMEEFVETPGVDVFVNLHEDFYQNNKMKRYEIEYRNLDDMQTQDYLSYRQTYRVILENKKQANKVRKVDIQPFSEDRFSEEQKRWIPCLGEEFVLPENLRSLCNAISSGDMRTVLFQGPSGTGKTMSCKLISQAIGLPIMEIINCTENLDEFVLGKYIPYEDRIVFKESYVTKAIRSGGAVVFEEINFAKPQYLSFLNSLLDDNGFVRLDNGDIVKRHESFRFFATMNMGYFGTKELNQALYNRFHAIVEIAALSDEAILRMLRTRVPQCEPVSEKMIQVYHKLKKKVEAEELDVVLSPRNLENWARLAKYEGYIQAAEKTILPIAKCDRALEETIRGILRLYKWE